MRAKTLILFVIALGCGLAAAIGFSQYIESIKGGLGQGVKTTKIFVAQSDINIGEKLDEKNTKLAEFPSDRIPEGAITDAKDLLDRFPRSRFYAGEVILRAKLMDSNDGSKSVDIPKGYRVVSVKVSMESSVSGLVQPGDRVDLVVFLRKNAEVQETGTKTILRDVNVFAVDAETERKVDSAGQARTLKTVSLLVKPEQAEAVMLANELGTMSLTLRRPDDTTDAKSEGFTIQSLLGNSSESANEKRTISDDKPSGPSFVQWLTAAASTMKTVPTVAPERPAEPVWTMRVMTPEGFREFQWHDPKQLPTEVTPGSQPADGGGAVEPSISAPPGAPASNAAAPPTTRETSATSPLDAT